MLSSINKCGGDLTWHDHLDDFGRCIQVVKLVGLSYSGLRYTWHNG
jgi:hypothetical protein